jgi:tetratricopeptide (TPR) repeat protein
MPRIRLRAPRGETYTAPMNSTSVAWEARLAELWKRIDTLPDASFVDAMRQLTAELPEGHAVALFEMGAAHDSTGSPQQAVELYELALANGLTGLRRRRVQIQMASSLRNLGHAEQAAAILFAELKQPFDELDQAVAAFLALALADLGREREALAISLSALSTYLPRYNRSLARYAQALQRNEAS